jgi:glyoxylase-like metal-dependent hydrolase (beta-lactamase superfamily II)
MASIASRLTAALAAAALLAGTGCTSSAVLGSAHATPPSTAASTSSGGTDPSMPEPRPVQIAPGVYMVPGLPGEVGPANLGRLGNTGFIVGDTGVIAIDTGVSYRHGQALLAVIARVTDRPVKRVVITHTRQEFLFGTAAFRERGIPVHMHRKAAQLMAARCEICLKNLIRALGEAPMRGTAVFKPDTQFDDGHVLDNIGRPVRVLYYGHSSGPGDVAVLDERTGTLFAGGLLAYRRIPDVFDSDLAGWLKALDAFPAVQRIVPGHGPVTDAAAVTSVKRYLTRLQTRLIELLESGAPLSEVPDLAALPEFQDWDQYESTHRRNASVVFVRLERDLLLK